MSELAPVQTPPCHPRRSRAATRQAWVERLARFPVSGLSLAQFCANEGVSLPSFYSWRRRLAAQAPAADDASAESLGPRLLSVRLPSADATLELVLPSGAVLRIPPGCDLALVRSLVQTLGDAPC
jgi:transposase